MEDMYVLCHDLGIDSALKASLYTVIDGHGGVWCAKFLLAEYVRYVTLAFKEELKVSELKRVLNKQAGRFVEEVFTKAYKRLD
jgi:protein phosphatase PTC2/3